MELKTYEVTFSGEIILFAENLEHAQEQFSIAQDENQVLIQNLEFKEMVKDGKKTRN